MFEPLTHDGMMRLARRERASPRRETPIRAESGRSPGAVEPEIVRVDDDVEHDDALRGRARRDHVPFTLGRALQMSGSAPNVAYKCCSKRCLHALEIQRPAWIARQRGKLHTLAKNRKAYGRVRMALGLLNGPGDEFSGREARRIATRTCKRSWK